MANEQNLIRPTPKQARENGKKGGKASAAAKKERKKLREELLALLSDSDTQEKMCVALVRQAQRGNIKAFEVVRDTIGEKPVDVRAEQVEIPDDGLLSALNRSAREVFADAQEDIPEGADV